MRTKQRKCAACRAPTQGADLCPVHEQQFIRTYEPWRLAATNNSNQQTETVMAMATSKKTDSKTDQMRAQREAQTQATPRARVRRTVEQKQQAAERFAKHAAKAPKRAAKSLAQCRRILERYNWTALAERAKDPSLAEGMETALAAMAQALLVCNAAPKGKGGGPRLKHLAVGDAVQFTEAAAAEYTDIVVLDGAKVTDIRKGTAVVTNGDGTRLFIQPKKLQRIEATAS